MINNLEIAPEEPNSSHSKAGTMVRLSSPLLGEASARLETRRHRRSFMAMVVVGSLALLCIGLAMRKQLPMGPRAPLLLQSRGPKANLMRQLYAEQLLQHGEELQAQATKEIKLGQQLAAANGLKPRQGMMLSSNDTDPCNGMDVGCRGVTVDMWPHNWEVKQLPGYKKVNDTDDANSTLSAVYEDYDYYNRKPLRDAGVNIGTWFWEPDDIDAPPRNESEGPSPEEKAADEELERILKKEENATTPEERLERAGVKLIGMPWDPNIDWRSYYNEDLEEDNEGGEGEESGSGEGEESGSSEEGAAEKSHPTFLKMQKHSQVCCCCLVHASPTRARVRNRELVVFFCHSCSFVVKS